MVSNTQAEVQALIQSAQAIAKRAEEMASRVEGRKGTSVGGLTPKMDASLTKESATGNTPVSRAVKLDTANTNAPKSQRSEVMRLAPRYLRYNVWDPESDFTPTTAEWTETAKPLSRPPQLVLDDPIATKTIRDYPDLFCIVTPINVDVFESYLKDHPNQPFVKSVWVMGIFFGPRAVEP